ncbi:SDR family oxidoreductase [Luteimonas abyssi]|uniref:SDR family oxidoreductase n=1 Tax=Luteimonas abyssi TaxID=1247514 RepID=UPI000737D7D6|nr:SDR family oxidoreductase [Luteimonas abyssi]
MDLHGRTVLVTGATGGIGDALVAALLTRGARVLAVARDAGRLSELARRHPPGAVTPFAADVDATADRRALLLHAQAMRPTPSVLVIAHARAAFGLMQDQHDDLIDAVIRTNLAAPAQLIRAALPMLAAHPAAAVVAVGSTFGSLAFPGFAAYSASKFGLRGLVEALAREHADGPVRFQYLAPRATRTAFNSTRVDALNVALGTRVDDPASVARRLVDAIERGTPRRQLGWPEAIVARLNALLPSLVDRSLARQLPLVRRHAGAGPSSQEPRHAHHPS